MIGDSLGSNVGKVIGSNEGIKLGYTDGKVLGTIIGNVDGITIGIDVGTDLGSLYGSFDSSNYVKLEGLFIGDSLGSTDGKPGLSDGKVLCSDECIKLGLFDGEVLGTILGNTTVRWQARGIIDLRLTGI